MMFCLGQYVLTTVNQHPKAALDSFPYHRLHIIIVNIARKHLLDHNFVSVP